MNNNLVNKYIPLVDEISNKYNYNPNIKHLLYLIIPAFVTKYTIKEERLITNTFKNTKIIISDKKDKNVQALYSSIPNYTNNNITTTKYITIQNYENISLIQLLDNLVHEFNHAINSYNQETNIKNNILYLRTGLTYATYELPTLKKINRDDNYILEEILNTNQTEQVINIIKNYKDQENTSINNTIYAINNETNQIYTSKSYYLENLLFKKILENKTFISTLNNLRLSGNIENIESWFDNITGRKNSYNNIILYLKNIMELEKKLQNQKYFKKFTINKIKDFIVKILEIINIFNNNCIYK